MRLKLAVVFLAATALSPAWGLDIKAASRIDAVTVYPQGAEVTRITEVRFEAGDHTIVLEDLPGELDQQSIRVEGTSEGKVEIGSVDTKAVYLSLGGTGADRRRIEADIERLQDERTALDQAIADADARKKLLLSLADRQLVPASADDKVKAIDTAQLGGLVDLVSAKLAEISKATHEAQIRQREIDKLTYDLQAKLSGLAPGEVAKTVVSIHLASPAAASGTFKVRYRIGNAGWLPFYDARLTSPGKDAGAKVELVARADVMQSTGESWSDVALTLSTARPLGATAAPDIYEEEITAGTPIGEPLAKADGRARNAIKMAPEMEADALQEGGMVAGAAKPATVAQSQAQVAIAGFQALYAIGGRVTVDNSGTAKKVRIATSEHAAALNAIAVPKLDPSAYLTAAFTVKSEAPLLPGAVNLYRDGVFMGQGSLPLLNPGEEAKLGFGADDLIKVKRAEVKRTTGEEGLITTSNIDERQWDIAVKNLHETAIPVTIIDQMPFSTAEAVTVEPMGGMTPPSERDLNKRRGVMAWRFDLDPGAEKTIKFGYKVAWPKELSLNQN